MEPDEARAKEHLEKLSGKLDAYEAILSKQKYLAGDVSQRKRHPTAIQLEVLKNL